MQYTYTKRDQKIKKMHSTCIVQEIEKLPETGKDPDYALNSWLERQRKPLIMRLFQGNWIAAKNRNLWRMILKEAEDKPGL